jgi:hypothetical protein
MNYLNRVEFPSTKLCRGKVEADIVHFYCINNFLHLPFRKRNFICMKRIIWAQKRQHVISLRHAFMWHLQNCTADIKQLVYERVCPVICWANFVMVHTRSNVTHILCHVLFSPFKKGWTEKKWVDTSKENYRAHWAVLQFINFNTIYRSITYLKLQ